jgi:cytochrome bd-type quinol oxidase subunit 2
MSEREKDEKMARIIKWVARVLSLPAILFALAHIVTPDTEQSVEESVLTWITLGVMFFSVAGLALGWWKERIGGWTAISAMVVFFILFWIERGEFFPFQIALLFLVGIALPAGLFILSYSYKKDAV